MLILVFISHTITMPLLLCCLLSTLTPSPLPSKSTTAGTIARTPSRWLISLPAFLPMPHLVLPIRQRPSRPRAMKEAKRHWPLKQLPRHRLLNLTRFPKKPRCRLSFPAIWRVQLCVTCLLSTKRVTGSEARRQSFAVPFLSEVRLISAKPRLLQSSVVSLSLRRTNYRKSLLAKSCTTPSRPELSNNKRRAASAAVSMLVLGYSPARRTTYPSPLRHLLHRS